MTGGEAGRCGTGRTEPAIRTLPGASGRLRPPTAHRTSVDVQEVGFGVEADAAALQGYAVHPEHLKVVALIGARRTSRACLDYDPAAL